MPLELNFDRLMPEFLVAGAGLAAIIPELLLPAGRRAVATAWTSAIGLTLAFFCLCFWCPEGVAMVARADDGHMITGWVSDKFSIYCRAVIAGGGLLLVLLSMPYTRRMDRGHGEYYSILLFALLGAMLVTGASDLLSIFVCLELVTIMAYVLAAFRRNHMPSTEAGLKYLVVGAVSTAILLLGIAFVYGGTGSLSLGQLAAVVQAGKINLLTGLGLGLLLIGMLFKVGGVPFHVWIPDVYEGSPSPSTAFLSTASKTAGVVLLLRFAYVALAPVADGVHAMSWVLLLSVIAIITLFFGSLGALSQRSIKRLLAYSSISHAGYLLMGIAAIASGGADSGGASAVLYYLLAYTATNLTAFAVIVLVSGASPLGHGAGTYRGLWKRSPFLALALVLAFLSLAGVPPMGGFFAKFLILKSVVSEGMILLAIVGAIGVVLGLYFYFLWVREVVIHGPEVTTPARPSISIGAPARVAIAVGMIAMLATGIFMGPFYEWASDAAAALSTLPG